MEIAKQRFPHFHRPGWAWKSGKPKAGFPLSHLLFLLSNKSQKGGLAADRFAPAFRLILRLENALLTVYGAAAAKVLSDHDRMQLAQAGFLHKQSQKLKGLVPDWYQTSFHTREYILQRLSRGFDDVRYAVIPDGMQDVVVARKNRS